MRQSSLDAKRVEGVRDGRFTDAEGVYTRKQVM